MILDYKDYNKILKKHKRYNILSIGSTILIMIVIILSCLYIISWKNNNKLQDMLNNIDIKNAEEYIRTHNFFFYRKHLKEASILIKLIQYNDLSAEKYFRENKPSFLPVYWDKYVMFFLNKGKYRYSQLYVKYFKKKYNNEKLNDYDCIISVILNNYLSSDRCIDLIVNKEELKTYIVKIKEIQLKNRFDWVVDRNGETLIYREIGDHKINYDDISIKWLKPYMMGVNEDTYYSIIRLTIDKRIQKEAYKSLGNYEGVLLLMKKEGELLAAVSKSKRDDEPLFIKRLPPGSIVKIVSTSAALRNNLDLNNVFPFYCKGFIVPYDKLIFYDWIEHKNIKNIIEALASSCNISFGIIGKKLGSEKIKRELEGFGINKEITLEKMVFKAGEIIENKSDHLYNYMLSIGDTYVKVSPILALMWVSAIINEGIAIKPYFVDIIKSVSGNNIYKKSNNEIYAKFTNDEYCEVIKEGMVKAVELDIGTGKRAKLSNYSIALKTGTAGSKDPDYDSIIIGYSPVEAPKVIFVLFAFHAGKASLEGANIIKKFLEASLPLVLN